MELSLWLVALLLLACGANSSQDVTLPVVLNQECYSERFTNLVCLFETNKELNESVSWNLTYITRARRHCVIGTCTYLACDTMTVLPVVRSGRDYQMLQCLVKGSTKVFIDAVYDWQVTGVSNDHSTSSLTSTKLSSDILKLKAPAVLSHIPRNDSLSVKVQLYEDDMLTISFGQLGMIEAAVMSQGINYLIDVESQHTETNHFQLKYTAMNTTNWLHIPNLQPNTNYTIRIFNQIRQAAYGSYWGDATQLMVTTLSSGTEMPRAPSDELSPVAVDSLTNYMTMTAIYVAEDGYAGYEARVGDTVTIRCRIRNATAPRDILYSADNGATGFLQETDNRKMRLEDSDWVNVTLRDVQIADSGMYSCSDDEKRLRVVESAVDPSTALAYETTTIVQSMRLSARLMMDAKYVNIPKPKHSSFKHYAGYVAKVGDTVTISCIIYDYSSTLTLLKTLSNGTRLVIDMTKDRTNRVSVNRTNEWLNVTIFSTREEDSGKYKCSDDLRFLTVVNPATPKNPPRITGHRCESYRDQSYVCTFDTNTISTDVVFWTLTFSTRERRHCLGGFCENLKCNQLTVVPGEAGAFDQLVCENQSFWFIDMIYDWIARGDNPFINHTSTLSTTLNSSVVTLGPPNVVDHRSLSDSISLDVALFHKDYNSLVYSYPGHVEYAVIKYGMKIQVTLRSHPQFESSSLDKTPNVEVRVYTNKGPRNWIHITDLEPFTTYDISVTNQLNNTVNTDIWSQSTNLTLSTKPTLAEVGPEQSLYGFTIQQSSKCKPKREVSLYWKGVPEASGEGNGVIRSYYINTVDNFHLIKHGYTRKIQLLNSSTHTQQAVLPGSARIAELCADNNEMVFEIFPANDAGIGEESSKYFIPAQTEVLELRECDISVDYVKSSDEMSVSWSLHTRSYNYTVFWCNTDFGDQCVEQVEWRSVESADNKVKFKSGGNFLRYKFGVSLNDGMMRSSGIIWHNCINHLDRDLSTPMIHVSLFDLEATVTIKDSCVKNTRRAEYYSVLSCVYDVKKELCVSAEANVTVDPCLMQTTILLKKYAKNYAFWVVSHAGEQKVKSNLVIDKPQQKGAWAIILGLVLAFTVIIIAILFSIYYAKKKRQAGRLKAPKLVQPVDLMAEKNDSSLSEESDYDDGPGFGHDDPYYQVINNSTVLQLQSVRHSEVDLSSVPDESFTPTERFYENKVDSDHQLYREDDSNYQTRITSFKDDDAILSGCSFDGLPNYYLRCVETDSTALSLSAELFCTSGDSGDMKIDLSRFLTSGSSAYGEQPIEYKKAKVANRLQNESKSDSEQATRLLVDVGKEASDDSANISDYYTKDGFLQRPTNKVELEYIRGSECLDNGSQVHSEESVNPPQIDVSENSSGDSGYVGRNLCSSSM